MLLDFKYLYNKYQLDIKGVIHIGAHLGQEYSLYKDLQIDNMMFIEPQPKLFKQLKNNINHDNNIKYYNIALGNQVGEIDMYIDSYNQGSSSILKPKKHLKQYPHIKFEKKIAVNINKLDNLMLENTEQYNLINIDVQGFELEVFKGAKQYLDKIDYIYTEVNRDEVYEKCAKIDELDNFLIKYNFKRVAIDWKGKTWGDAFYIKTPKELINNNYKYLPLNKYFNTWGLTKLALEKIYYLMNSIIETQKKINILEFGSGISTKFLVDSVISNNWEKNVNITSFDDNIKYMPTFSKNLVSKFLFLHERKLLECSDFEYENMFNNKSYNKNIMKNKVSILETRQKNCFYDIKDDDLNKNYNLVIIDGPHGNGRNISFLHLKNNIQFPCFVYIDDFTHYDFIDRLKMIFKVERVFVHEMHSISKSDKFLAKFSKRKRRQISAWERGGTFAIFKILECL